MSDTGKYHKDLISLLETRLDMLEARLRALEARPIPQPTYIPPVDYWPHKVTYVIEENIK